MYINKINYEWHAFNRTINILDKIQAQTHQKFILYTSCKSNKTGHNRDRNHKDHSQS